ncbi:hypothetical protein [Nesterenkonia rhizosphaerae]|uniref:Uncharacterized protein n=1 Tax=Nesterenkonia rhizosphaerae TaxID=1348272 RepID=A0ABP9FZR1_9MICC
MKTTYLRVTVLLGGAGCVLLSAFLDYQLDIGTFGVATLSFFPLLMGALWYLAGSANQASPYGWAAGLSTIAALVLPISLSTGPALGVLAGTAALAIRGRDPIYFAAFAATLVASLVAGSPAFFLLGLPIHYAQAAPPAQMVYPGLAAVFVLLAVIALAQRSSAVPEPKPISRDYQQSPV